MKCSHDLIECWLLQSLAGVATIVSLGHDLATCRLGTRSTVATKSQPHLEVGCTGSLPLLLYGRDLGHLRLRPWSFEVATVVI